MKCITPLDFKCCFQRRLFAIGGSGMAALTGRCALSYSIYRAASRSQDEHHHVGRGELFRDARAGLTCSASLSASSSGSVTAVVSATGVTMDSAAVGSPCGIAADEALCCGWLPCDALRPEDDELLSFGVRRPAEDDDESRPALAWFVADRERPDARSNDPDRRALALCGELVRERGRAPELVCLAPPGTRKALLGGSRPLLECRLEEVDARTTLLLAMRRRIFETLGPVPRSREQRFGLAAFPRLPLPLSHPGLPLRCLTSALALPPLRARPIRWSAK
ncbi:hypothetical protein L1887_43437 [Cichorium endivia]|nr:hypothetical protein L1887_43437 [Cichorium endivia]